MAETKKYVRIKKATREAAWYVDKIGKVFEVELVGPTYLIRTGPNHLSAIHKEDAELFVTEKRPAKVGERVLITKALPMKKQAYEAGDVFEAATANDPFTKAIRVFGMPSYIDYREYEVIVNNEVENEEDDEMKIDLNAMGYDELIAHGEEVMRMIRIRAYGEGYKQGKFDADMDATYMRPQEKFAQARRDEIVEQAKADVEELVLNGYDGEGFWGAEGNETYRKFSYSVEFLPDRKKRKVTALIRRTSDIDPRHIGRAKAAPDDCFNVHIGKAIALRRALGLAVPDEYLNAPQPTKVRVGDVVSNSTRDVVGGVLPDDSWRPLTGSWVRQSDARKYGALIIDDSREEVGE